MKKKIVTCIILCLIVIPVKVLFSQDFSSFQSSSSEVVDYYVVGKQLFEERKYYEAVPYLEQAGRQRKHRNNLSLFYQLGEASRLSRLYEKAMKAYAVVVDKSEPESMPYALFYLSQMQMVHGQYEQAMQNAKLFMKLPDLDSVFYTKASVLIHSIEEIEKWTSDTDLYAITLLPDEVNINPSNYGGFWIEDRLWYTSSVEVFDYQSVQFEQGEAVYESFFIDRLFSSKMSDDVFSKGMALENLMYSRTSNYLPPVFSPDGKKIYTTICQKLGQQRCWIYGSDYHEGGAINLEWVDEPVNDFNFSSKDPSVVLIDGVEVMFFASRRSKAYGFDLYYVLFDSVTGEPGDIISLGDQINTCMDEISPFYDVKTRTLFFSSNGHPGQGLFDVYFVRGSPFSDWSDVQNPGAINSSADDYYYHQVTHYESVEGFVSSNRIPDHSCCDQLYAFEKETRFVNVEMHVRACYDSILIPSFSVIATPLGFDEPYIERDVDSSFTSLRLIEDRPFVLQILSEGYEPYKKEIFPDENPVLKSNLMPKHISLSGTITGHQLRLPMQDGSLLFLSKAGDTLQLVAADEGTYVVILETNEPVQVHVSGRLHYDASFDLEFSEEELCSEKAFRDYELRTIDIGGDILQNKIEFKTASFEIKKNSFPELNRLADFLMEHTDIVLEVQGHTDNVGAFEYNMYLSQNRSESITRYLINRGVSKYRLEAKGYSFSEPIATNDTPEGRAKNRRVGFEVTEMDDYTREIIEMNQK